MRYGNESKIIIIPEKKLDHQLMIKVNDKIYSCKYKKKIQIIEKKKLVECYEVKEIIKRVLKFRFIKT
jgi:hypothetical protein